MAGNSAGAGATSTAPRSSGHSTCPRRRPPGTAGKTKSAAASGPPGTSDSLCTVAANAGSTSVPSSAGESRIRKAPATYRPGGTPWRRYGPVGPATATRREAVSGGSRTGSPPEDSIMSVTTAHGSGIPAAVTTRPVTAPCRSIRNTNSRGLPDSTSHTASAYPAAEAATRQGPGGRCLNSRPPCSPVRPSAAPRAGSAAGCRGHQDATVNGLHAPLPLVNGALAIPVVTGARALAHGGSAPGGRSAKKNEHNQRGQCSESNRTCNCAHERVSIRELHGTILPPPIFLSGEKWNPGSKNLPRLEPWSQLKRGTDCGSFLAKRRRQPGCRDQATEAGHEGRRDSRQWRGADSHRNGT